MNAAEASKRDFHQWRAHPWHGLSATSGTPGHVHAYVEMTPYDLVKYEVDKESGYVKIDRPQRTSSLPPTLYGFVPQTYCGDRVRDLMPESNAGDGDPLDICVLSERPIDRAEILLNARVVGGLPMCDGGEADDKIVAVLNGDLQWDGIRDISELPKVLIARLEHYFLTYKLVPGEASTVTIGPAYGYDHAKKVVNASIEDYQDFMSRSAGL